MLNFSGFEGQHLHCSRVCFCSFLQDQPVAFYTSIVPLSPMTAYRQVGFPAQHQQQQQQQQQRSSSSTATVTLRSGYDMQGATALQQLTVVVRKL
jgi:hypothetical protein